MNENPLKIAKKESRMPLFLLENDVRFEKQRKAINKMTVIKKLYC